MIIFRERRYLPGLTRIVSGCDRISEGEGYRYARILLSAQIRTLRKTLDAFNRGIYRAALSKMTLREGISEADAIEYYEIMQEMFNGYFSSPVYADKDFRDLVSDHEERLSKLLNMMLYGIGERRTKK